MALVSGGENQGYTTGGQDQGGSERSAQRKRLFSVLFAIGAAALIIGFFGLLNTISSPFPKRTNVNQSEQDLAVEDLKRQDTDADGLSDYDEIFTFRTSIFVKDSDSDGKSDAEETAAGGDPNCPEGITCGFASANTNAPSRAIAGELRQVLKKSGAPSYVVDQSDDAALLQAYKQTVLGGANINGNISESDLENLSATQVRSLLKANGVDDASLQGIDDATLLGIFHDALTIETPS